jgi:transposase-like protein
MICKHCGNFCKVRAGISFSGKQMFRCYNCKKTITSDIVIRAPKVITEKIKQQVKDGYKRYYEKNIHKCTDYNHNYYLDNKERISEYKRQWWLKKKENEKNT